MTRTWSYPVKKLAATVVIVASALSSSVLAEPLGIPACDAFLTKYDACTARMPAAQQDVFNTSVNQMRTGWKGLAANPQTRASLDSVCTQMSNNMKTAMTSYGCKW